MKSLYLYMEYITTITCPHCHCADLQKNGHSENGAQRWHCKGRKRSFQLSHRYRAREPGVKEQIDLLPLNSSEVWDTKGVLGINKGTVMPQDHAMTDRSVPETSSSPLGPGQMSSVHQERPFFNLQRVYRPAGPEPSVQWSSRVVSLAVLGHWSWGDGFAASLLEQDVRREFPGRIAQVAS